MQACQVAVELVHEILRTRLQLRAGRAARRHAVACAWRRMPGAHAGGAYVQGLGRSQPAPSARERQGSETSGATPLRPASCTRRLRPRSWIQTPSPLKTASGAALPAHATSVARGRLTRLRVRSESKREPGRPLERRRDQRGAQPPPMRSSIGLTPGRRGGRRGPSARGPTSLSGSPGWPAGRGRPSGCTCSACPAGPQRGKPPTAPPKRCGLGCLVPYSARSSRPAPPPLLQPSGGTRGIPHSYLARGQPQAATLCRLAALAKGCPSLVCPRRSQGPDAGHPRAMALSATGTA